MAFLPFVEGEERAIVKHQKKKSEWVCFSALVYVFGVVLEWESDKPQSWRCHEYSINCRKKQIFYRRS
jgi:predicted RNA-binding protein